MRPGFASHPYDRVGGSIRPDVETVPTVHFKRIGDDFAADLVQFRLNSSHDDCPSDSVSGCEIGRKLVEQTFRYGGGKVFGGNGNLVGSPKLPNLVHGGLKQIDMQTADWQSLLDKLPDDLRTPATLPGQ